jgi:peptidoglycan/LPS O-acetylase OafA/YrhL
MHRTGRLPALDMLRGVAILLVLGRHAPELPAGTIAPIKFVFDNWHRGGWIGVDLFFVLSGFLVSGLIFREIQQRGSYSPGRFLLRRALRIYPPFYFLLALTPLMFPRLPLLAYVPEALYFQNYIGGIWGHTWSLAVEEQFYLLLPWLLAIPLLVGRKMRQPLQTLPVVLAAIAVLCLVLRIRLSAVPFWSIYLNSTQLRLDSLAAGVFISYMHHFYPAKLARLRPYRVALVIIGLLCCLPAFIFALETTPFIYIYGLTLFYAGAGLILVAVIVWQPIRIMLPVRVVAWIGFYSYSIYLFHHVIDRWLFPQIQNITGPLPAGVLLPAFFACALLLGFAMGKLIEAPALRLRDAIIPASSVPRPLTSPAEAPPATLAPR